MEKEGKGFDLTKEIGEIREQIGPAELHLKDPDRMKKAIAEHNFFVNNVLRSHLENSLNEPSGN